jgi:hypothetical protein
MTTSTTQEQETSHAPAASKEPEPPKKKGHASARKAHVGRSKARSAKKTTPAKNGAKTHKQAAGARHGSKTAKVLDLLKRSSGVTLKELMKATGWQAHSVRGFISGTLGKKMGLTVASVKGSGGERTYSTKA